MKRGARRDRLFTPSGTAAGIGGRRGAGSRSRSSRELRELGAGPGGGRRTGSRSRRGSRVASSPAPRCRSRERATSTGSSPTEPRPSPIRSGAVGTSPSTTRCPRGRRHQHPVRRRRHHHRCPLDLRRDQAQLCGRSDPVGNMAVGRGVRRRSHLGVRSHRCSSSGRARRARDLHSTRPRRSRTDERVYLTEDHSDGALYRFTPSTPGDLSSGVLEVATGVAPRRAPLRGRVATRCPNRTRRSATPTRHQVAGDDPLQRRRRHRLRRPHVWFTTKGDNRIWQYDAPTSSLSIRYQGGGPAP